METAETFAVGALVQARGREWVVLPESQGDMLILRPLGGTEDEITGIYLPLEPVTPAAFALPDPSAIGDFRSCRLLRDAIRLGFRSSAGPFRAFAKIAVEPRPYQLVPLLMALKLEPVRLLIADDVGIGKTIEAALVVRELLDRGEVTRLTVLCPPHLAEQWQAELAEKFHIDAELVLPSTITRLERLCAVGQSLFEVYPYTIVSLDYIKSDRRRDEFLRTCPELVVVDEAHTCAQADMASRSRQQRHHLLQGLARDPDRHLILVTATPHSGKEEAFRSLLSLLDPAFANLPADLTGPQNEPYRRRLAAHLVQRRRGDIRHYLQAETPFPLREEAEETYVLGEGSAYKKLFDRVLKYARQTVANKEGGEHRQRVRWWSMLALLRSLASSPAAAAATLRNRSNVADTDSVDAADEIGQRTILDLDLDEVTEGADGIPGSDYEDGQVPEGRSRRYLLQLAREAEALQGDQDSKLQKALRLIQGFLHDGFHPIIFCRFIPTAEYVGQALRQVLPPDVEVGVVTGTLPPAEREARVLALGESPKRVLVCTDCLSEGINLQDHFDAVMHYDLSWNPTRHEQREGRVDRFGQPRDKVRVLTYYGLDNQIDGIVLEVLLRKHKKIRSSLGISVPVPVAAHQVVEAIFEGLLLKERSGSTQLSFDFLETVKKDELHAQWDLASERETRSKTMFAQETIKVAEVARELAAAQAAVGSGVDVANFFREALQSSGATVSVDKQGYYHVQVQDIPPALREALGQDEAFVARFALPVRQPAIYLHRTHPLVEALASYVMNTALDPLTPGTARRCGVIRTRQVARRTTLLLLRYRYHLITTKAGVEKQLLAEDCQLLGFTGAPEKAQWLPEEALSPLLACQPDANITPDQASEFVAKVIAGMPSLQPHLEAAAVQRGKELLAAHCRVRTAARLKQVRHRVEPHLPPDVLGIYVYLPVIEGC